MSVRSTYPVLCSSVLPRDEGLDAPARKPLRSNLSIDIYGCGFCGRPVWRETGILIVGVTTALRDERILEEAIGDLRSNMIKIVCVPGLDDNYVWLAHETESGETTVVDPAVSDPILEAASGLGWHITQIWNTHWHPDHIGGNVGIKVATGALIAGPAAEQDKIASLDRMIAAAIRSRWVASSMRRAIPKATSYPFAGRAYPFCWRTLLPMGCVRRFEGEEIQMYDNMQRLAG